jgi:hypothetical protein
MHGIDARAMGGEHRLMGSPSVLASEVEDAVTDAGTTGNAAVRAGLTTGRFMLDHCVAVLAGVGFLLIALFAIDGHRNRRGGSWRSEWVGALVVRFVQRRGPPPVPRVALCVSLS